VLAWTYGVACAEQDCLWRRQGNVRINTFAGIVRCPFSSGGAPKIELDLVLAWRTFLDHTKMVRYKRRSAHLRKTADSAFVLSAPWDAWHGTVTNYITLTDSAY